MERQNHDQSCELAKAIKVILAILFILCLLKMPYGFYQLVRYVSFIGFAYFSYEAKLSKIEKMMFVFIAFALVFQPFFKITLGRMLWNIVDVILAISLIISIFYNSISSKNHKTN